MVASTLHTPSLSFDSTVSSKPTSDDGELLKDTEASSTTSNSPIVRAQDDTIHALEDIDEHEHLLKEAHVTQDQGHGAIEAESDDQHPQPPTPSIAAEPVTWRSLPHKGQLFLLMLARCSEPLTQTSLQAYMYYQLQSFDRTLPDSAIATQVGYMQGSFTVAQFLTAFLWGKAADSSKVGRKRVILIGLLGTAVSAVGFGFSRSFAMAMFFRCFGGALNGNVGVMRTMISEIVKEKKYQSRAFMILPMTFNIGVIIGPTMGGLLADPAGSFPGLFGDVWWMKHWPYALPNLVSGLFLLGSTLLLLLGLDETHYMRQHKPDWGRSIGRWFWRYLTCRRRSQDYMALPHEDADGIRPNEDVELQTEAMQTKKEVPKRRAKLPFRRIWTPTVLTTFICHALLAFHVGSFNPLWFTFLSAPRFDSKHPDPPDQQQRLPFHFTGGFAMTPRSVGISLSIIGVIGIALQVLVYPWASTKYGNVRCYRATLALFPVVYLLAPYLSLIPSNADPPKAASGALIWVGISGLLFLQVLARTFALPANIIIINNCCPHPSVLGQIHGLSQSISSGVRTLGPVVGGWLFGLGLQKGIVGLAWWMFAIEAMFGCIAGIFVREGSGHEILLPGEEDEEKLVYRTLNIISVHSLYARTSSGSIVP